jgi:hypothetical protein
VKNVRALIAGLTVTAVLSSCAAPPIGPTVQVMPTPGKPFDLFVQEENGCKAYAQSQIAGAVEQANNSAVGAAVLTTALGAASGALVGGGYGARVGTAGGAVAGADIAAGSSAAAQGTIQQRYDGAYSQCMYSKGNQVPGYEPAPPPAVPAPGPANYAPPAPRYDPALVISIQTELGRIGLLSGTADGQYGPKTRGAISDYQKMRGMPRDGIPTPALLDDLRHN